jgi:hypothetical protein
MVGLESTMFFRGINKSTQEKLKRAALIELYGTQWASPLIVTSDTATLANFIKDFSVLSLRAGDKKSGSSLN